MSAITMTVLLIEEPAPRTIEVQGRCAWALQHLIRAGDRGCTPLLTPGPRWSDYVFKLRKAGIAVETVNEQHQGAFPGVHARYVLRSRLQVVANLSAMVAA